MLAHVTHVATTLTQFYSHFHPPGNGLGDMNVVRHDSNFSMGVCCHVLPILLRYRCSKTHRIGIPLSPEDISPLPLISGIV